MFFRKLKKKNAELESDNGILQQRIVNQVALLEKSYMELYDLKIESNRIKLERLKEANLLSNLKKECNEKDEQIKILQDLINKADAVPFGPGKRGSKKSSDKLGKKK